MLPAVRLSTSTAQLLTIVENHYWSDLLARRASCLPYGVVSRSSPAAATG
jgi:hypothetical protein